MKYNICDIVDIYILKYSRYSLYWRLGCCLSSNLCLCRLLFTPFNIDIGAPACRDWFCLCSCLSRRQHEVHSQFIKSSRSSCDTPRFFLFVFRLGRSCSCLKNFFSKINSILVWDRHRSSPPTYAELRCSTRNSHRHPKSRVDYKDVATSALDADPDWMSATQVWGHHYLENTCCCFISSIVYIKQFFHQKEVAKCEVLWLDVHRTPRNCWCEQTTISRAITGCFLFVAVVVARLDL